MPLLSQDHQRALRAAINRLPADWQRLRGRPRRTWLRTVELDLQPNNLGLNSAWKRAQDLKMASTCGDGYAHWRVRHLTMMMMTQFHCLTKAGEMTLGQGARSVSTSVWSWRLRPKYQFIPKRFRTDQLVTSSIVILYAESVTVRTCSRQVTGGRQHPSLAPKQIYWLGRPTQFHRSTVHDPAWRPTIDNELILWPVSWYFGIDLVTLGPNVLVYIWWRVRKLVVAGKRSRFFH